MGEEATFSVLNRKCIHEWDFYCWTIKSKSWIENLVSKSVCRCCISFEYMCASSEELQSMLLWYRNGASVSPFVIFLYLLFLVFYKRVSWCFFVCKQNFNWTRYSFCISSYCCVKCMYFGVWVCTKIRTLLFAVHFRQMIKQLRNWFFLWFGEIFCFWCPCVRKINHDHLQLTVVQWTNENNGITSGVTFRVIFPLISMLC